MQELSAVELNAILLHELAHLRRWDDWTNLIQKIVGAVLFFHPAVWWIEKKLALEREMACDDLVLAKTASPRAYAECLVSLAEKSLLRRGLCSGPGGGRPGAAYVASGRSDHGRKASSRHASVAAGAGFADRNVAGLPDGVFGRSPAGFVREQSGHAFDALATLRRFRGSIQAEQVSRMGSHVVPAKFVVPQHENAWCLQERAATTSGSQQ